MLSVFRRQSPSTVRTAPSWSPVWLPALALAVIAAWSPTTASAQCTTYTIAAGPAAYIAGTTDIGNHGNNVTTGITFPFPVTVYGTTYTSANVCSDGFIQFADNISTLQPHCLPYDNDTFTGPVIFPYWIDLSTASNITGAGIFTTTSGSVGSRTFVIEWRLGLVGFINTKVEILFYENQNYFDVFFKTIPGGNKRITVGAQASPVGPASAYECHETSGPSTVTNNLSLRFTPTPCDNAGSCCVGDGRPCYVLPAGSCPSTYFTPGGICSPDPCPAPPSYDTCAGAIDLSAPSALPYADTIDGFFASPDTVTTDDGARKYYNSIWYKYVSSGPGFLSYHAPVVYGLPLQQTVTTPGVQFAFLTSPTDSCGEATALHGHEIDPFSSWDQLLDPSGFGFTQAGQTVFILVASGSRGGSASTGILSPPTYDLTFDFTPSTVPSNDTCGGAFNLNAVPLPFRTSVDNLLATDEDTNCFALFHGVWYTYTPTVSGYLGCTETGSQQAVWAVANDCSSTPTCQTGETNLLIPMTAGQPIKLLVGSSLPSPAPYHLDLTFALAPDDCATALPISSGTIEGQFRFATPTPGDVSGLCDTSFASAPDFWYALTVPNSGQYTIQATPIASDRLNNSLDTPDTNVYLSMAIFSNCPDNSGTLVACTSRTSSDDPAMVSLQPTLAPGTYKIRLAYTYQFSPQRDEPFRFQLSVVAPTCPADFDGNNTVNVSDIFAFLRAWFAHSPSADIDGNSTVNVNDIFAFLRHWFAHC